MNGPVIITPRLLPGLHVGHAFLSVDPTDTIDHHGKPLWHWYVDLPDGTEHEGCDLATWGDAGETLHALCDFLSAAGEAYQYHSGMEADSCTDLFAQPVCEWALQYANQISMCALELEESA